MMAHEPAVSSSAAPAVVVDDAYFNRLYDLAVTAVKRNSGVGVRLLEELERATVLPSRKMPPKAVNIGSRVTFRDDTGGSTQTVVLVLPGQADITSRRVSILTPIGAALIGLMEGATIDWETPSGDLRSLTVLEVGSGEAE